MKIICIACPEGAPEIEEDQYPQHMQQVHGGGQLQALQNQRNIPKGSDLPPGVNPSDLPSPEFMQTIAEMEKEQQKPKPPVLPQPMKPQEGMLKNSVPVAEKTPPHLIYMYEGMCKNGHPLTTLELDVKSDHFVIAYCAIENKQIQSRQVRRLDMPDAFGEVTIIEEDIENIDLLPPLPIKKRGRKKKEVKESASI
ncbi:MAG: hypothetical protein C5B43_04150 [Verrucomicrobia bacterium]|nr:MAG: hypothetical protein C5B43_04150 [Verrucomicrobiota bacterium]